MMNKLPIPPKRPILRYFFTLVAAVFVVGISGFVVYKVYFLERQVQHLDSSYQSITTDKDKLAEAYDSVLFEDHLLYLETLAIDQSKQTIEAEYEKFKSEAEGERLAKIEAVFATYQETVDKVERNANVGEDTTSVSGKFDSWGQLFLNQEFDNLSGELTSAQDTLDTQYEEYLASLPTPTPTSPPQPTQAPAQNIAGYSYQAVSTSRGTFYVHMIKQKLSDVTIKTISANTNDCDNNCPNKSLAQYVSQVGGFAGIHGTYFCPPDYSQCNGKTYSYDYPFYNSSAGKWLNQNALNWNNLGLMTFSGKSLAYAGANTSYGGGSLTAGVSNFPMLVKGGNVVVGSYSLDSYQSTSKGARGAIGVDDSNVYLVVATGATVPDMAYIMKALGATAALNLDGGGSSAMYISGVYKVGPGRSLPNAIVLVK
ncbi:phosphodiester glycosidase family protein [candidate division WWE3 bacterium]|uniref:Phosphodiester glycosidase family protein n=1 Tax=candidate division WWE3 bacterium TaxID=2053526 RepID=A0A955LG67_UNCKA|nr:phosphodiester glycosidase family protein [candidate division WWE3 bacterium]